MIVVLGDADEIRAVHGQLMGHLAAAEQTTDAGVGKPESGGAPHIAVGSVRLGDVFAALTSEAS